MFATHTSLVELYFRHLFHRAKFNFDRSIKIDITWQATIGMALYTGQWGSGYNIRWSISHYCYFCVSVCARIKFEFILFMVKELSSNLERCMRLMLFFLYRMRSLFCSRILVRGGYTVRCFACLSFSFESFSFVVLVPRISLVSIFVYHI